MEKLFITCVKVFVGSLIIKEHKINEDLADIHRDVYENLNMKTSLEDKVNLCNDVHHIRKDFKTSVKNYKIEVLGG